MMRYGLHDHIHCNTTVGGSAISCFYRACDNKEAEPKMWVISTPKRIKRGGAVSKFWSRLQICFHHADIISYFALKEGGGLSALDCCARIPFWSLGHAFKRADETLELNQDRTAFRSHVRYDNKES